MGLYTKYAMTFVVYQILFNDISSLLNVWKCRRNAISSSVISKVSSKNTKLSTLYYNNDANISSLHNMVFSKRATCKVNVFKLQQKLSSMPEVVSQEYF